MERKKRGKRRRERDEEGMREREIDGGVSGWEKEGDWKREREIDRERENGEWKRCAKIVHHTMNMNTLCNVEAIFKIFATLSCFIWL